MSERYRTIVADPPWKYDEFVGFSGPRPGADANGVRPIPTVRRSRPLPYPSMDVADIAALPIGDMATDDAWLWLWTTNRYLPDAFPIVSAWGFDYAAQVVWHKGNGVSPFSQSPVSAVTDAEFLIVGRNRKSRRIGRLPGLVIQAPRGGAHSRKPELFLDLIETVTPGPYLELFARRQRLGWDTWGDQALQHVDLSTTQTCTPVDNSTPPAPVDNPPENVGFAGEWRRRESNPRSRLSGDAEGGS